MDGGNFMTGGIWVQAIAVVLIVLSFYFTLTFFQQLKSDDARIANQSKRVAVICLALALAIPAFYNLLFFQSFMR